MLTKKNFLVFALLLIGFNLTSQNWTIKSSFGDKVKLSTKRGNLLLSNQSLNTLSIEFWRENKKLNSFQLAPGMVFTDTDKFFKRTSSKSKEIVNFNSISKGFDKTYIKVSYDKNAYNKDLKIIRNEYYRKNVYEALIPLRNLLIRFLGGGDVLFFKSLIKISVSNKSREEKIEDFLIAFGKKAGMSTLDGPIDKIIAGAFIDVATLLNKNDSKPEFLEFLNYCTSRLAKNESKKYYLKDFKFKFYPQHTISFNASTPFNVKLRSFKNDEYGNRNQPYPEYISFLLNNSHQTFSLELLGSILTRGKSNYGRFAFLYGINYEQGEIFYSKIVSKNFPNGIGFTQRKYGLQFGFGIRLFENDNLMGLELQGLTGIFNGDRAEVSYNPNDIRNSIVVEEYNESFNSMFLRTRIMADLKYLTISFDYQREIDTDFQDDANGYFISRNTVSIGVPIFRVKKIK